MGGESREAGLQGCLDSIKKIGRRDGGWRGNVDIGARREGRLCRHDDITAMGDERMGGVDRWKKGESDISNSARKKNQLISVDIFRYKKKRSTNQY